MVWVETPTNPLLKLADLRAIAEICRERGIIAVADNTFASPCVQRPLELGFDIVVHSTTKYLNGHSDVIGGVAVVGDERATSRCASGWASCRTRSARSPGPFDSFLALRGVKTLRAAHGAPLRATRWRSRSGCETQPKVARVHYPGLRVAPAARAGASARCTASAA